MKDVLTLAEELGQALARSDAWQALREAEQLGDPEKIALARQAFQDLTDCVQQLVYLHVEGPAGCGGCPGCGGRMN